MPWNGALVKLVGEPVPAIQINALRFWVQIGVFALMMLVVSRGWPARPRPLWPLLARGAFMATGSACLYAGFRVMPLADAAAIYFVEPLLVTLLAALVLREPVGWRRFSAVGVGLVGAWIVTGPKFDTLGLAALWPLGAAVSFAATSMFTRRFAALGDAPTMQFYASIIGALMLTSAMALFAQVEGAGVAPVWLSQRDALLIVALGVSAGFTSLLISNAFRIARASVIAPFQYVELLAAAGVGWLLFREAVSPNTVAGAALILAAGLFVFWREHALRRRA